MAYVVLDVDGTLVGSHDEVHPATVTAITEVKQLGIKVGYATGRMHAALAVIDADLQLPGPHVVHNGGLVRNDGATAASWPLHEDDVRRLEAIAADHDAYVELYLDEGFLVNRRDPRAKAHWDLLGSPPRGLADERDGRSVIKATFIAFDPGANAALISDIEAAGMAAGAAGSPLTPGWSYINATSGGVHKGAALGEAAALAGTDLAHTMAVGDGGNDLPMLAVAGTAVAMGQASAEVHAAAHLVTDDVDAGGLALALRSLVVHPTDQVAST